MACPQGVWKFMHKTHITIKPKEECNPWIQNVCTLRETKDYKNCKGLEKALWKIFDIYMSFEGLVSEERVFYAPMLQEQNEHKQVRL